MSARIGSGLSLLVGACVGIALNVGCFGDCPDPLPLEAGDRVVTAVNESELQWMVGAEISFRPDDGEVTIRYQKDGSTFEVLFAATPEKSEVLP